MVGTAVLLRSSDRARSEERAQHRNPKEQYRFNRWQLMMEGKMPRELIDTGTDKRYVRRDEKGQFKESDDVGRSHAADQKRDSSTKPKRGEGDKGDR